MYYGSILSEDVKHALQQPRPYYLTGPIITRSFSNTFQPPGRGVRPLCTPPLVNNLL